MTEFYELLVINYFHKKNFTADVVLNTPLTTLERYNYFANERYRKTQRCIQDPAKYLR